MNREEEIEAVLRRQPTDERAYDQPMTALAAGDGVQRVRSTGTWARRRTLPALAAIALVVAVGGGVLAVGYWRGSMVTFNANVLQLAVPANVACFGQGPGAPPQPVATSRDGCPLMVVPPAGYGAATWTLDPSVPYSADAADLHVLVTEWECHGTETLDGRIVKHVEYGADTVAVTLVVRQLGGAQTCPAPPPTAYVVHLDQPVGPRNLEDGGLWPPAVIAAGGHVVVSPTPTPYPSNWHQPMDCTGAVDDAGFFKATSMFAKFDVYCAVRPSGWSVESRTGDDVQPATDVTVTYRGPGAETLALYEGDVCGTSTTACVPGGGDLGTAMFGDREGKLVAGPPGADYGLYVARGQSPSWTATGTGMSLETFKSLAAALILVGKW